MLNWLILRSERFINMDFVWETVHPDSSLDAELVYLSPVYLVSYIKGPKRPRKDFGKPPRIKISIREYMFGT